MVTIIDLFALQQRFKSEPYLALVDHLINAYHHSHLERAMNATADGLGTQPLIAMEQVMALVFSPMFEQEFGPLAAMPCSRAADLVAATAEIRLHELHIPPDGQILWITYELITLHAAYALWARRRVPRQVSLARLRRRLGGRTFSTLLAQEMRKAGIHELAAAERASLCLLPERAWPVAQRLVNRINAKARGNLDFLQMDGMAMFDLLVGTARRDLRLAPTPGDDEILCDLYNAVVAHYARLAAAQPALRKALHI